MQNHEASQLRLTFGFPNVEVICGHGQSSPRQWVSNYYAKFGLILPHSSFTGELEERMLTRRLWSLVATLRVLNYVGRYLIELKVKSWGRFTPN